ncbi:MAG TPA: error-prone DNA polymerase [Burkholderiaceae bacterium]
MFSLLPHYAELHCLTNFSFLRGASHAEELVARAHKLGYHSLAITDECSLAGVVRAHVEAKKLGMRLIVGSEMRLECGLKLVLLAMSREGYGNLAEWISVGRCRAPKGSYEVRRGDVARTAGTRLRSLPECLALFVPDCTASDAVLEEQAAWVAATFGDRGAIALHMLQQAGDEDRKERLATLAARHRLPLTACGDVHMHVRSRKPLQDVLTAVRLGKPVAECGMALQPNAEQCLRARLKLAQLYPAETLRQSVVLAERCDFSMEELRYQYPEEIVPPGETLSGYLRRITREGACVRYPHGIPAAVQEQLEKELALIEKLSYEPYFLTVYDVVHFARSRRILCQGRGSAANSSVCYCLGITEVDPTTTMLLFERFISEERNEPPDIDVDFEHERREEVMQYIYNKYGRHRAALTAAVVIYHPRSALKDVGKALGMDFDTLNRLSKLHQWWDGGRINTERMQENGLDPDSPVTHKLLKLTQELLGFPRHLSQHSGGFVIARDSLARLVPIENAAMAERNVIQWDKDDLDAMGLLKIDVLALGMLTAIRRALDFIGMRRGEVFAVQDIPREDPAVYDMICRADTIGVFQIESRAQMSMLPRLRPREFYDLVIEVAIVRPGPIQGDMVHPYLQRRQGKEKVEYYSPELEVVMKRTLGVPIFQEQVMQIAMVAAGFSGGEADDLRRSMAGWKRKGGLHKYYEKITKGMAERGYPEEFAERICKQIQGFGEYGFPESHAASFALLVYISAWIKHYEPAAFLACLLNSQPMGFYSAAQLVQDAKRHGVEVRPPDVVVSDWDCALEETPQSLQGQGQPAVRLGLRQLKGLNEGAAERIAEVRAIQAFDSVEDLRRRAELTVEDLHALARADALATLSGNRRQAAWQVAGMHAMPALLKDAPIEEDAITIPAPSEGQEILSDYANLSLTLRRHPLALLRERLRKMRLKSAAELHAAPAHQAARACGLVTMRQRPYTAKGTLFVTLEDETGNINVIVWPALFERQRKQILNARLMAVYGSWQREGEVTHLVAQHIVDHSDLLGTLTIQERNFH